MHNRMYNLEKTQSKPTKYQNSLGNHNQLLKLEFPLKSQPTIEAKNTG